MALTSRVRSALLPVSILLLAATAALAASIEERPWKPGAQCRPSSGGACSVEVQFGSVCCGPNREAAKRIRGYVERSSAIKQAVQCPNGKEGEFALCLSVAPGVPTQKVFDDLQGLAAPRAGDGTNRGTVSVVKE